MSQLDVSIVIPTLNEAENIVELNKRIHRSLSVHDISYELIIVDDNSDDGTGDIVEKLAKNHNPIKLFTRYNERDLSTAVIYGFNQSSGEILVCMDADLSHPPETLPAMINELRLNNCDFVVGSRYVAGGKTDDTWGFFRWINSKVATLMARPFTSVKDPMSGFFALPKNKYRSAGKLNPIGYKIGIELIVKCSCKNVSEIPIHFASRRRGKSKLNFKEQVKYLQHLKRLADFKYGEYSRLLQFCFVGATGMVWDLALYKIMLDFAITIYIARAIAIWAAMSWNYWCNRRLSFSYSRKQRVWSQYLRFIASCGIGAIISWGISVSLPEISIYFKQQIILAAFVGIVCGTITNFLLSRWWVFGENP